MKNIIVFCSFFLIIFLIIGLNLFNFWGTIGIFVFMLLSITIATILFPHQLLSVFGGFVGKVGMDNNYRLLVLGVLVIVSLLLGVKYGPGEPMLLVTAKEVHQHVPITNSPNLQKMKNFILWGETVTDQSLIEKGVIKAPVQKSTHRTWIFWKLAGVFSVMFIFYLPFAFSDEVLSFINFLIDEARKRQKALKTAAPEVASAVFQTAKDAVGGNAFGLMSQHLGGQAIYDLVINFLQKFASLFSKGK